VKPQCIVILGDAAKTPPPPSSRRMPSGRRSKTGKCRTRKKYEIFPKFMDCATYTKFAAEYMVSEREDLTRIGDIKAK
jgi:hypothetical protein